eukprot:scaffold39793_cov57-Phaeocystis_antarctica.AAC.2
MSDCENETTFVKRFSPRQRAATLDEELGSFAMPSSEATSGRLVTRSPLRDAEGKEHAPVPPATLISKDVVQTARCGRADDGRRQLGCALLRHRGRHPSKTSKVGAPPSCSTNHHGGLESAAAEPFIVQAADARGLTAGGAAPVRAVAGDGQPVRSGAPQDLGSVETSGEPLWQRRRERGRAARAAGGGRSPQPSWQSASADTLVHARAWQHCRGAGQDDLCRATGQGAGGLVPRGARHEAPADDQRPHPAQRGGGAAAPVRRGGGAAARGCREQRRRLRHAAPHHAARGVVAHQGDRRARPERGGGGAHGVGEQPPQQGGERAAQIGRPRGRRGRGQGRAQARRCRAQGGARPGGAAEDDGGPCRPAAIAVLAGGACPRGDP